MENDIIVLNISEDMPEHIISEIKIHIDQQNDLQFMFAEFVIVMNPQCAISDLWFDCELCEAEYDLDELTTEISNIIVEMSR